MAPVGAALIDERFLASGDEAGTAPGDRSFRPDVEGLRAVAVALVVLYHANVPRVTGGYVGVDVFFVISGFVITGLLLRERAGTGHTSILAFYGRRCRRIIPAATLVILITVLLSYHVLGFVSGNSVALDGRWAAVFLSNFHFQAVGTNYLSALRPPSPLQNYWSLSVEEQFYAVFPMLVVLLARARGRLTFEVRLAIGLVLVILGSFSLSVVQTASDPNAAYFSPFTRAWELALGALIAVGTKRLRRIPRLAAAIATWVGLTMVLVSAVTLDARSAYPGSVVAIPVLGTGLIIAGGSAAPRIGVESLLRLRPFRWLGRLSYSLYLWHWPILVLAAESRGETSLPVPQSLWWVALSLAASVGTYLLVENPIRHASSLGRSLWASIGVGLGLTAITVGVLTVQINAHGGSGTLRSNATNRFSSSLASTESVRRLVLAAAQIRNLPANVSPSVGSAYFDFSIPGTWTGCSATYAQSTVPACSFGDPHGAHTVVLYGDSHALMWARAINDIAIRARWRFVLLAKAGCPAAMLSVQYPAGLGEPVGGWTACDRWHRTTIDRINRMDPDLVIVTQAVHANGSGGNFTPARWQAGLERTLRGITAPHAEEVILGDIPRLPQPGPNCLARHTANVQACAARPDPLLVPYNRAERAAAAANGARYIDVASWFCSKICTAIIGHYEVYVDRYHVTNTYARFLEGVLTSSLHLPILQQVGHSVPNLQTLMLIPTNGSTISGNALIDAKATDNVRVTKVEFRLTGGRLHDRLIGTAKSTLAGQVAFVNTFTIPNGNYLLQSVAYDVEGKVARSKPISVSVRN